MPPFSSSSVMILSQGLLPLNLMNTIESNFTLFDCRFCCKFSITSPNFEMILNVDEEISCQDKGGGGAFTYSVFLAPAWPLEE